MGGLGAERAGGQHTGVFYLEADTIMDMKQDLRRLIVILSVASFGFGMIPAFLVGHWLFFLGAACVFVAMLWIGYYTMRWLEKRI